MKKTVLIFFMSLIASTQITAQRITAKDIKVLYRQKVPLRDGINLAANIFIPENMSEPLPAIMVLTPYNNDHNTKRGIYFSTNGYVFVTVDCRGRGDSEGVFTPFENAGKDGYDAVEWIAKQPWCNGKVATMGGSYKGMDQWLIAKENPPHLVTMSPTATVCPGIDATRDRNIYRGYNLNILSYVSGKVANKENFFSEYSVGKVHKNYEEHLPYAELLNAIESPTNHMQKVFKRWISHPTFDDYWKEMLPSKSDYERFNIPILSITGYFDDDQPGHMHYYDHFQKYASEKAKANMYFVIGPWDHSGTRRPKSELGGLNFGEKAVIDILGIHKEWFDWTMKNADRPPFLKDHVTYFKMGENNWHYVPNLESMANSKNNYYLSSESVNPKSVFHSGRLSNAPVNEKATDQLIYNPLESAYKRKNVGRDYLTDQTYINEKGWLYYHSPVFENDMEISGFLTLNAYIEINTPDTDFEFKVFEVKPDGTNVFLGSGVMRARFRNSLEKEELVEPEEVNLYKIKSLYMLNKKVENGSQLRLIFGYLDTPDFQKNYNSGKDISYETATDAKTATIKLYCNKKFPSHLEIPTQK